MAKWQEKEASLPDFQHLALIGHPKKFGLYRCGQGVGGLSDWMCLSVRLCVFMGGAGVIKGPCLRPS